MNRPEIGTTVYLANYDHFLTIYHGASIGSGGRVVGHSAVHEGDQGVLVDWGDGRRVRCEMHELKVLPEIKKEESVRELSGNPYATTHKIDGTASEDDGNWAIAQATLALAYEQRTTNLVALATAVDTNGVHFLDPDLVHEAQGQLRERLGLVIEE